MHRLWFALPLAASEDLPAGVGWQFDVGSKMSKSSLIKYSSIAFVCFFIIGWNAYRPLRDAATDGIAIQIAVVSDSAADGILQPFLQSLITSVCVGLFGVALLFSVFNTVTNVTFKKALLAFVGYLSIGLVVIAGGLYNLRDNLESLAALPGPRPILINLTWVSLYPPFLWACVIVLLLSFVIRKVIFKGKDCNEQQL